MIRDKKGLTLVELLISIVLVGIVLALLFGLLFDLKAEADDDSFALNNQVNRIEAIKAVQDDLIKHSSDLVGVEDKSDSNGIIIKFHFKDGESSTLSTFKNGDNHYVKYFNYNRVTTSWKMNDAIIDNCGDFTFYKHEDSNNYYFRINIRLYNKNFNEKNNKDNNNLVDDIEISYIGDASNLVSNLDYLNSDSNKIGNCSE